MPTRDIVQEVKSLLRYNMFTVGLTGGSIMTLIYRSQLRLVVVPSRRRHVV